MNIGIESLVISISFILPGFITTRLINARTASIGREQSIFEETTESLLRSVYINLIIGSIFTLFIQFLFIPSRQMIFTSGIGDGFSQLSSSEPLLCLGSA